MIFLDRVKELKKLRTVLRQKIPVFVVMFGRRRCGKSALLKQIITRNDIYYIADQSEASLQRVMLAKEISQGISGFDKVSYPDWQSLFTNLNNSSHKILNLFIDEFPYLVKSAPELPSVLQKYIDTERGRKVNIIICGSSQQMMQGLILNSTEPLYGRADEIFQLSPLKTGWIQPALHIDSITAIEEYATWGGVPRYWELRKRYSNLEKAIKNLILDKDGVLYEEPLRLFLDDMRSSVQAYSILSLIGMGCHKLSEIAGRLEKPTTQFSRPLSDLIRFGYIKREIPFNENEKTSKKGLYKINDPFLNFYFNFVMPNKSRIEMGLAEQVYHEISKKLNIYFSNGWEELVRSAIPHSHAFGVEWGVAKRWWGTGLNGNPIEIDAIAESVDRESLLIGEAKWTNQVDLAREMDLLKNKIQNLPFTGKRKIYPSLWVKKNPAKTQTKGVFLPQDVLEVLK